MWITWKQWRIAHPGTEVLSTDTGALRSNGSARTAPTTPIRTGAATT
ncbi:DUF3179 domain-containing protein [Streptomyces sp. NBC_00287]|nr:hypothetical protein [Streptomyces sp. NBC_00287]